MKSALVVAVLLRHVIFCTLYCLPNCPLVLLNIKYFVKFYSFTLITTNNYDTRNELCKLHVIQ